MSGYKQGEALTLVGYQYYNQIISSNIAEAIKDIMGGRNREALIKDPDMCCMDIFVYGYIMGKRAERAKKRK